MPNVPNNVSRSMRTYIEGAVQPIGECALWYGTQQVSATGATSSLPTYEDGDIPPGIIGPYLTYSDGSLSCPSSGGGGAGGPSNAIILVPNSYNGIIKFYVRTTDGLNRGSDSNTVTYTTTAPNALSVNVGADFTALLANYDGLVATVTGGPSPATYVYSWVFMSGPAGATPTISPSTDPDPVIIGMTSNGDYVFKCTVTVPGYPGLSANDSVTITRTGGVIGMSVAATFANSSTTSYSRAWTIDVTGGTPPFSYEWFDPDSVLSEGIWRDGLFTGSSSSKSGTGYMDQCTWPQDGFINVVVTDSSSPPQSESSAAIFVGYNCFLEGTPVMLADGSETPIETLKIGDEILGTNILTYENDGSDWKFSYPTITPESTKIVKIVSVDVTSYININNNVKATSSHPILIYRDYEYQFISLGNVVLTDKLVDKDGGLIDITSIEIINENGKVYLLDTTPFNTYIAAGIVSHNKTVSCDPG